MSTMMKNYRKRVGLGADNQRQFTINEIERNFLDYLAVSPTSHRVQMTEPEEVEITKETQYVLCAINDITQNDKRALDEKKVLVPKDAKVDVGCYFFWDNCYWIIIFKEHKTLDTYKKFIARRCNQILNYKHKGIVYKIPVSIENLTMYSDGLADLKYTSQQDSKRMFTFGSNPITRTIIPNTRVMLTRKTVFRVTHINDFEFNGAYTGANGIIKTLVLQTTLLDEDDLVNNIAWNKNAEADVVIPPSKIVGDSKIMIGGSKTYRVEDFNSETMTWVVSGNNDAFVTTINGDNTLTVKFSTNVNYTGESFTVKLVSLENGETLDSLVVKSRGFM